VVEIIKGILVDQGIHRFSIMSFSLGSRFVWPLISEYADQLNSIFLLAPDSLPESVWYKMATSTKLSRWVLRQFMSKQTIIATLLKAAGSLGFINRQTLIFLKKSIDSVSKRQRIYHTWNALRLLVPDIREISELILDKNLEFHVILAEYDNLIDYKRVVKQTERMPGAIVTVLPCQHHQLLEKFAASRKDKNSN
jgi:pimeloyl-ACP methyl ester carboxylesterase